MADELIDIFDENNKPLNIQKMKSEAHKKGLWHRAAHIWIYNSKKEVLLQLRSKNKDMFPDKWDISVAGHVSADEKVIASAIREIKEEIDLSADEKDLEFYKTIKHKGKFKSLIKNQFIYIFSLKYEGDIKNLKHQKEEIQKIKFFPISFIRKDYLKNPHKYTIGEEYWMDIMDLIDRKITKVNS